MPQTLITFLEYFESGHGTKSDHIITPQDMWKNVSVGESWLWRARAQKVLDLNLYFEMQDEINTLGFDTSEFGKNAIIINGLPSELSKTDGAEVIIQILEDFKTNFQELKIGKKEALRQATAKNAAIKAGKALTQVEMKTLITDLMNCKQSATNESGNTIIVKLTKTSLERFFQ